MLINKDKGNCQLSLKSVRKIKMVNFCVASNNPDIFFLFFICICIDCCNVCLISTRRNIRILDFQKTLIKNRDIVGG